MRSPRRCGPAGRSWRWRPPWSRTASPAGAGWPRRGRPRTGCARAGAVPATIGIVDGTRAGRARRRRAASASPRPAPRPARWARATSPPAWCRARSGPPRSAARWRSAARSASGSWHRRHRRRAPRVRRQPGHIGRPAADRAHPGGRGVLGRQVDPGRQRDRRAAGDARGAGPRLAHAHAADVLQRRRRPGRARGGHHGRGGGPHRAHPVAARTRHRGCCWPGRQRPAWISSRSSPRRCSRCSARA